MSHPHESATCLGDEVISAHLDGDLDPAQMEAVGEHLAACDRCRRIQAELKALRSDLGGLPAPAPAADLWPAIAERRAAERSTGFGAAWRRFWFLPVSAAVGAAATLLVVWMIGGGADRIQPAPKGPVTALQSVLQAEQIYAQSIGDLEQAMGREKPAFSPKVQQTIAANLAEVDRAIEKCRQAVRQNPRDLAAHESMLAAYQHKVDFMTELLGEQL